MADEDEELLGMFVQEAVEHLETIEPDLLTLEERGGDTDPEIINRLFRGVHSIKGSAGFFGLTSISRISHIMENLLGKVRERLIVPDPGVTDGLLAGLDKLKTMISDVSASEGVDASEEIAAIEALLAEREGKSVASQTQMAANKPAPEELTASEETATDDVAQTSEEEEEEEEAETTTEAKSDNSQFNLGDYPDALVNARSHGRNFFAIAIALNGNTRQKREYAGNLQNLLESVGEIVATAPPFEKCTWNATQNGIAFLFTTVLEKDLVQSLLQMPLESITEYPKEKWPNPGKTAAVAKPAAPAPTPAKPVTKAAPMTPPKPAVPPKAVVPESPAAIPAPDPTATSDDLGAATKSTVPTVEETLRVSVSLLDELINNAGELVLARNQLLRASANVAAAYPEIMPLIQNLDAITSRVQEKVMQARMQPVSVVFNKFPRLIRDLAKKLGKKIDLEIRGGEVELDKSVIEHLSDPLTHMIRNVADHAIELPKDRLAAAKSEAGQVILAAYHENGMVNISLGDDGAGMDVEKIKMKALEKGVISERQADSMSEQEALNLIFAPGFSMAKKVSDVSGRGVGMDVVKTNIEKLGGSVYIETKIGKGTRIILKLPLTLAIIPAMIVSTASQRFAIPEAGLVEIVRITEGDRSRIEMVGNAPVLRLRNTLLPLIDLAETLSLNRVWPTGSKSPDRRRRWADRRVYNRKEDDQGVGRRDPEACVAYILVLNVGGNEVGLLVDEVLDSEEIVVKPMPSFFKDNPCLSATTILGDGNVALIIDFAGVVESANINFTSKEHTTRADLDEERRAALRERQNIVILETSSGVLMGIVHGMIRRVEKISPKLIEHIGHLPYVRYYGKTFRAIYPDQVLNLEGMGFHGHTETDSEGDDDLCMVVPNIPGIQAGLIFSRIVDTKEMVIDLDPRAIPASGLIGSAHIEDHIILFPDVYAVFELAQITSEVQPIGHRLKAIVVDDTPFLRALVASYLSGAGFIVDQAEDGQMAISLMRQYSYDLLVTDLNMPGMDGFELLNEVQSTRNPDLPVIATTSSNSVQLEQKCTKAGFVSCVSNIDKLRLLKVVSSVQQVA